MTLPFQGELMECVLCGRKQESSPTSNLQWRGVEINGDRFYACPQEFPPDGSSVEDFSKAYEVFLVVAVLAANPSARGGTA